LQTRAGIVMFHGGALRSGSAAVLAPNYRQLASRGILAVSAGYRLLGQGAMSIDDCIADVRRAVEDFSALAAVRGLESSRLASGGSSAGAHLALVALDTSTTLSARSPRSSSTSSRQTEHRPDPSNARAAPQLLSWDCRSRTAPPPSTR